MNILMMGFVGSGKSSVAATIMSGKISLPGVNPETGFVYISDDRIREMLYGKYEYHESDESGVLAAMRQLLHGIPHNNRTVIVDAPLITKNRRSYFVNSILNHIVIHCHSDKALQRRLDNPRGLPKERWESVYRKQVEEFEPVTVDEGFDAVYFFRNGRSSETHPTAEDRDIEAFHEGLRRDNEAFQTGLSTIEEDKRQLLP